MLSSNPLPRQLLHFVSIVRPTSPSLIIALRHFSRRCPFTLRLSQERSAEPPLLASAAAGDWHFWNESKTNELAKPVKQFFLQHYQASLRGKLPPSLCLSLCWYKQKLRKGLPSPPPTPPRRRWEAPPPHNIGQTWLLELCPRAGRWDTTLFPDIIQFHCLSLLIVPLPSTRSTLSWLMSVWQGQDCRGVGRAAG